MTPGDLLPTAGAVALAGMLLVVLRRSGSPMPRAALAVGVTCAVAWFANAPVHVRQTAAITLVADRQAH